MADVLHHQRQVTRLVLARLAHGGFALAGSGAIREHGLTSRPTEDVDLFAATPDRASFDAAVETAVAVLRQSGYTVVPLRRAELFARLEVTGGDGTVLEVDLGVDWRAHPPVLLDVGPVLAVQDAVANKVGALYSPGEARDYLDVDQIRQSGRFTDSELLQLAADHDPGFDGVRFAEQLHRVSRIHPRHVEQYGTTAAEFVGLQRRLNAWAAELVPD